MNLKESEEMNIKGMKEVAGYTPSDAYVPTLDWERLEKLAAEMSDDDPLLKPGYHQFGLDERTKNIIRAKGMIKARDNFAKLASMLCGV